MVTKHRIKAKGKKGSKTLMPKADVTPQTEGPKPARSRRSRAGAAEAPARPAKLSALEAAVRHIQGILAGMCGNPRDGGRPCWRKIKPGRSWLGRAVMIGRVRAG